MFRRFAYQAAGPEAGGWGHDWTPPWMQEEHRHGHGPRGPFRAYMRRGPFGGPFGGHMGGHFGGQHGEGGRFFGRGDMKFALLHLLQERPMYGYEMIKALEERSGGFYTPSPGSIYPTLQMLEERGFVSAAEVEGKKVYSITDSGRALLEDRRGQREEFAGPPWMRQRRSGPRPELQALRGEAMEVARLFGIAGRVAFEDPEKLSRLRAIIASARKELSEIIYGETGTGSSTPGEGNQSPD